MHRKGIDIHIRQAAYALRLGLAVAGALYLSLWLRLENPYWAPTTILVVEGMNYGAVSDRLFKRLAGNIAGTLLGILVLALFAQTGPVYALACGSLTMLGTYAMLETRHPLFWRWAIAAAGLVTLSQVNTPTLAFYIAVDRVSGVTIGLVIAALSHQVFFPHYAGDDYRNQRDNLIQTLSGVSIQRANQARQNTFTPQIQPGTLIHSVNLLRIDLHHACRDTESFRKKRAQHERFITLLKELAGLLTLICIEPPSGPFDLESRTLSSTLLRDLAWRLTRLRTALSQPDETAPSPSLDEGSEAVDNQPTTGPWCELLTLAHGCMDRIEHEVSPEEHKTRPTNPLCPPRPAALPGERLDNACKALLAGAATTLGMMLWRLTGWPGGSSVPLLAMFHVIFCTAGPAVKLRFFITIQALSMIFSAALLFFILPAIHSTEFFFIVIAFFFTFWGWIMHAPNPRVRALGVPTAILINSCVYGYTATMASFTLFVGYAGCMVGSLLISSLLLGIFYPFPPRRTFSRHASGCHDQLQHAITTPSADEAIAALGMAGQHAQHMLAWAGAATQRMPPAATFHAAMTALTACCLSSALSHHAQTRKKSPSPWIFIPENKELPPPPQGGGQPSPSPAGHLQKELFRIYTLHTMELNKLGMRESSQKPWDIA